MTWNYRECTCGKSFRTEKRSDVLCPECRKKRPLKDAVRPSMRESIHRDKPTNKIQISITEYRKIISSNGGLKNLTVFGCYTYTEGSVRADGRIAKERDIYTEWGRRDDETPLVASHTQGSVTTCYKFEKPKFSKSPRMRKCSPTSRTSIRNIIRGREAR